MHQPGALTSPSRPRRRTNADQKLVRLMGLPNLLPLVLMRQLGSLRSQKEERREKRACAVVILEEAGRLINNTIR